MAFKTDTNFECCCRCIFVLVFLCALIAEGVFMALTRSSLDQLSLAEVD